MSTIDPSITPLKPTFPVNSGSTDPASVTSLIEHLSLLKHPEGGYFAEIDRDPLLIPNPFLNQSDAEGAANAEGRTALAPRGGDDAVRNASTSIYYLLTPSSPQGCFHRNKGRTVHTLIQGRGRYVLIHADGEGEKKRVESFVVGHDVAKGERSVWIVEGGKYKASYLLAEEGLLISETVVPGFEYSDHNFLTEKRYTELVTEEQAEELKWLVRQGPPPEESELL